MVEAGVVECAMALGFEKMAAGSLGSNFNDRAPPLEKTISMTAELGGFGDGPFAAQIFGNGGEEYCKKYGATWTDISSIGEHVRAGSNRGYS
jgi:sterol carrier protein 2